MSAMLTAFRALPLSGKVLGVIISTILFAGLLWVGVQIVNHFVDRLTTTAITAGAAQASAEAANTGLAKVEEANRAEEAVARNPDVRRAECLRDSRTPENC